MNRTHRNKSGLWLAAAVLLIFAEELCAQNFTIDWFTVDGGGGTSMGGLYAVSGTVGQPEAGQAAGGGFTIEGGFWGGVSGVPAGTAPRLSIQASGGGFMTVSWTPGASGFVLQQSDSLAPSSWTNAPSGGLNPAVVPAAGSSRFFRLKGS